MNRIVRISLFVLCALLVLAAPFTLSSPNLLEEAKWEIQDAIDSMDSGALRLLFPAALAQESEWTVVEEEPRVIEEAPRELPIDFSPGMKPNPAGYTEDSYEDASIRVQIETRKGEGNLIWRIAWVEIASPSQLRTAFAGKTVKSDSTGFVSKMAEKLNAVVAINGDNYSSEAAKHSFIYRMGECRRAGTNKTKDILIIDENGDFHTVMAQEKAAQQADIDAISKEHTIVNAFMFGPALVHQGELVDINARTYDFNRVGSQPRTAIGQIGHLSYVLVIADNPRGSDNEGVSHAELAEFMLSLNCQEAYNLDGGNSAIMIFNGKMVNNKIGKERDVTDIIYFATSVAPEEWEK